MNECIQIDVTVFIVTKECVKVRGVNLCLNVMEKTWHKILKIFVSQKWYSIPGDCQY